MRNAVPRAAISIARPDMTSIVDILDERTAEASAVSRPAGDEARLLLPKRYVLPHVHEPALSLQGVTVIVPCYNEQDAIVNTVRRLNETLRSADRDFEVLIVNDGSTDYTTAKLRMYHKVEGLRILSNDRNRGYGYSIKRAVAQAKYETIVIVDADGTYPIEHIDQLVRQLDHADMVVGARTAPGACIPLTRRPAKWALRKLASYLAETHIPDLNSGLRVMKRSLIRKFLPLLPDGFSFTTTITLAMLTHGHEVSYVPIDYAKRIGKSSIRPVRDTLNFLSLVVRTVLYFRPLKVFVPAAAGVFAIAVTVALVSKLALGQVADVTSVTLAAAALQLLAIGLLADLIDKRSPSYH